METNLEISCSIGSQSSCKHDRLVPSAHILRKCHCGDCDEFTNDRTDASKGINQSGHVSGRNHHTILHDVGSNRDTTFRHFVGMVGPKNSIGR